MALAAGCPSGVEPSPLGDPSADLQRGEPDGGSRFRALCPDSDLGAATFTLTHLDVASTSVFNLDGVNSVWPNGTAIPGCGRLDGAGGTDDAFATLTRDIAPIVDFHDAFQSQLASAGGTWTANIELSQLAPETTDTCVSSRLVLTDSAAGTTTILTGNGSMADSVVTLTYTTSLPMGIDLDPPVATSAYPTNYCNGTCTPSRLTTELRSVRARLVLDATRTRILAGSQLGGFFFVSNPTQPAENPTGLQARLAAWAASSNTTSTFGSQLAQGSVGFRDLATTGSTVGTCTTLDDRSSISAAFAIDSQPALNVTVTSPLQGSRQTQGNPMPLSCTIVGATSPTITWTSDRDGVVGSSCTMSTSSLSVGTHTLVLTVTDATGASATAYRTIVVQSPPVVTIVSPQSGASWYAGTTATLQATATSALDGPLPSTSIWWTYQRTGGTESVIGTGSPKAWVVPSLPGTGTLRAYARDSAGLTSSWAYPVAIFANAAPVISILSPANNAGYIVNNAVTLRASASDAEDGTLSGTSIRWTYQLPGQAEQTIGTGATQTWWAQSPYCETKWIINAYATDSRGVQTRTFIYLYVAKFC
jgi:hypothetical protein